MQVYTEVCMPGARKSGCGMDILFNSVSDMLYYFKQPLQSHTEQNVIIMKSGMKTSTVCSVSITLNLSLNLTFIASMTTQPICEHFQLSEALAAYVI